VMTTAMIAAAFPSAPAGIATMTIALIGVTAIGMIGIAIAIMIAGIAAGCVTVMVIIVVGQNGGDDALRSSFDRRWHCTLCRRLRLS